MQLSNHPVPGLAGTAPGPSPARVTASWRELDGDWFSPGRMAALLLAFAAIWLTLLGLLGLSPPIDDIEQLTWVRSLEWGYYKHPPLPTWLLWLPVRLFGLSAWTTYILGAACTLGAVGIVWHLLVELRGRSYAALAVMAALCVTYYNRQLDFYNHEVVLLLLSAASAALCWRAVATGRLRWWIGLGLVLGLGSLSKYQVVVTIACVLAFAAQQRAWRSETHRRGAALAALTALVMFSPHAAWLVTHRFQPVQYAMASSLGVGLSAFARTTHALHWLVDQLLNRALPALLLLGFVAVRARGRRVNRPAADPADGSRALLLIWGGVPLLFMPMMALVFGAELPMHWGAPYLLFAVPAVMELTRGDRWEWVRMPDVVKGFVALQVLLLVVTFVTSPRGPLAWRSPTWRNFDSAALAREIGDRARTELGGPIRVVVGDAGTAGALAVALPEHPLVLIDGRFDRSPWVSMDLICSHGVLQIDHELDGGRPVGAGFSGLEWRVLRPDLAADGCHLRPAVQTILAARG